MTICHVKRTQSTALEQKRFDLRSLSPALFNLWLLLVWSLNRKLRQGRKALVKLNVSSLSACPKRTSWNSSIFQALKVHCALRCLLKILPFTSLFLITYPVSRGHRRPSCNVEIHSLFVLLRIHCYGSFAGNLKPVRFLEWEVPWSWNAVLAYAGNTG